LTSFVVMSLSAMGRSSSPVVEHGVRFLLDSMRDDGSWPIDTNLATWVTSLSIRALAEGGPLPRDDTSGMREWLVAQQSVTEHPFTHAAAGAWAWTPLPGGVPDADDTSGALLALHALGAPDARTLAAVAAGARWLLGVQNRDGGIPTFCRGWGALPFDRSTPEITAHALQAWGAWYPHVDAALQRRLHDATARGLAFLARTQRQDGSWVPLWFGNEAVKDDENPTYGTANVLQALSSSLAGSHGIPSSVTSRAVEWLLAAQNTDGGWGGASGLASSVEETGVALAALGRVTGISESGRVAAALERGRDWLTSALSADPTPSPIGLYFARLWYFEELYPAIFAISGLAATRPAARPASVAAI
jgi:squalene-hopene/tetraprenyl-beta-curcumene cyclase